MNKTKQIPTVIQLMRPPSAFQRATRFLANTCTQGLIRKYICTEMQQGYVGKCEVEVEVVQFENDSRGLMVGPQFSSSTNESHLYSNVFQFSPFSILLHYLCLSLCVCILCAYIYTLSINPYCTHALSIRVVQLAPAVAG